MQEAYWQNRLRIQTEYCSTALLAKPLNVKTSS